MDILDSMALDTTLRSATLPRGAGHRHPPAWAAPALIVLLPMLLAIGNDTWLWDSTAWFDTNTYVGLFRHYTEFKSPFTENYKASRLPFVLPAVALYKVLPAGAAHHALFLGFLVSQNVLLLVVSNRRCGPRVALVVAAAASAFTFLHAPQSYHGLATSTFLLLSIAALQAEWPLLRTRPGVRFALCGAAFASAACIHTAVVGLAPMVAASIVALPATPRGAAAPTRLIVGVGLAALGGVAAVTAWGLANLIIGGPFLFFTDLLEVTLAVGSRPTLAAALKPLTRLDELPHLTFPLTVAAAAVVDTALLVATRRRRVRSPRAMPPWPFTFLLALAASAAMQQPTESVLDSSHLFQPFQVGAFLAAAALLSARRPDDDARPEAGLDWAFLVASGALAILPLALLGGPVSRALARSETSLSHSGAVPALVCAGAGLLACAAAREHVAARALLFLTAFSALNVLRTSPYQPAWTYQLGEACSFRADAFSGVIEANQVLSAFDPESKGAALYPRRGAGHPQFDGAGWCTLLPEDAVIRSMALSHYFMTSQDFIDHRRGERKPPPIVDRIVFGGSDEAAVGGEIAQFQQTAGPSTSLVEVFRRRIARPTYEVFLRGYRIERR